MPESSEVQRPSVCATALTLFGLSLLLVFLGWSTPLPKGWVPCQGQIISIVGFIGVPVLGGLVASRRPENLYGWLWLDLGLSAAGEGSVNLAKQALRHPLKLWGIR